MRNKFAGLLLMVTNPRDSYEVGKSRFSIMPLKFDKIKKYYVVLIPTYGYKRYLSTVLFFQNDPCTPSCVALL